MSNKRNITKKGTEQWIAQKAIDDEADQSNSSETTEPQL